MFTVKLLTGIWEGHVPEWHRYPGGGGGGGGVLPM